MQYAAYGMKATVNMVEGTLHYAIVALKISDINQRLFMTRFATAYAQQLYLLAEAGIHQAKKDNAQYWYVDGSFPEEYPNLWSDKRIASLNKLIHELHG